MKKSETVSGLLKSATEQTKKAQEELKVAKAELDNIQKAQASGKDGQQAEIAKLQKQVATLSSDNQSLQDQLKSAKAADNSKALQTQLDKSNSDAAQLKKDLDSLRESSRKTQSEAKDSHDKEIKNLKQQLAKAQQETAEAKNNLLTELQAYKEKHALELDEVKKPLLAKVSALEKKLKDTPAEPVKDTKEVEELSKKLKEAENENKKLATKLSKVDESHASEIKREKANTENIAKQN